MMAPLPELRDQARQRWRGVLGQLGVPQPLLDGKQHPCPICGGKDRFRFDDIEGDGTWFCNQCGAGNGISLALKVTGLPFQDLAKRVHDLLPSAPVGRPKPPRDDARCFDMMRDAWESALPIAGTMAEHYLRSRRCWTRQIAASPELRFAPHMRAMKHPSGHLPALLARVTSAEGRPVNIARTFLENGAKAYRAVMPGPLPDGCAVRLMPAAGRIGAAEGIETAIRASARFGLPVWATISAGGMERWTPPAGTDHVDIFGDSDRSYSGQASAYILARKLTNRREPIACTVHLPDALGTDWADEDPNLEHAA